MSDAHQPFISRAIELSRRGMEAGQGGPFGAVIVRDGAIIGEGYNRVLATCDPTAHAEVTAIRDASARVRDFRLAGCAIYVNGLPCPMCMAAIFWARIDALYYVLEPEDAAAIGFDDRAFYDEIAKPFDRRRLRPVRLAGHAAAARAVFDAWAHKADRTPY